MRLRPEHQEVYLEMCENHAELLTNKFNGPEGKSKGNAIWQNLTINLNALGYGKKTNKEWRKVFTDWKCKVKAKASKMKIEKNKTGGGPPAFITLSALENKLIELIGQRTSVDCDYSEECGLGQVKVEVHKDDTPPVIPIADDTPRTNRQRSIRNRNTHTPYNRNEEACQRLVSINEENLNVMREINENLKNISHSLQILAEAISRKENE